MFVVSVMSRQVIWAELRRSTVFSLPEKHTRKFQVSKYNEQRKRNRKTVKPAGLKKKTGGASDKS
jgi:hypothetical protein